MFDPALAGTLADWVQKAIPVAAQYGGAGVALVLILVLIALRMKSVKSEAVPPPVSDGGVAGDRTLPVAQQGAPVPLDDPSAGRFGG